ncbi:hypothetical protein TSAR_006575 [Trichomalopsis sarcophagae]|uniref:Protein krueppel n=1 Tax=Trichomalopsis sarcophagae TaxID=543379 RepID=A0A232ESP8_9HYME|nr:hypothetical protein TSAR_006575 [Trichomalopsis sarcophagae]
MNVINGTGENKPKLILICRICGEASDSYVNIFGHEGTAHSLSKKISTYLQLQVSNYDLMPKIACNKCFHKLEEFHYFFLASKKVQLMLKNAINESLFSIVINVKSLKNTASSENPLNIVNENENCVSLSNDKHKDKSQTISNSDENQEETKSIMNNDLLSSEELDDKEELNSLIELGMEDDSFELKPVLEDIDLMDVSIQLSCLFCTETFEKPRELIDHFSEQHCDEAPVFKCIICGSLYKDLKRFYTHYHKHGSDEYTCKICGKLFTRKWSLQLHAAVHTDAKPYNCDQCDKLFKTMNALRDHKKKHLSDKPLHTCDHCGKSFRSKFILESHKRIHTGEEYFICNLCSKSFTSKSLLIYHMSIHNYKENIKCRFCNKLVHTEKLSEHLSIHTFEKKPFKCEFCEKRYRFPSQLKQHVRLHTGELPYKCEDCPKRFRLRNALIIHQRQHTGVKPFECKTCDRAFTDFANYNKHMKRIHYNTISVEKMMS